MPVTLMIELDIWPSIPAIPLQVVRSRVVTLERQEFDDF